MGGEVSIAVIASEAKQSIGPQGRMDCFVAALLAMTKYSPRHSGARRSREPGIHNHDREYGFSDMQLHIIACAKRRIPE
jgi:hypothetical protein